MTAAPRYFPETPKSSVIDLNAKRKEQQTKSSPATVTEISTKRASLPLVLKCLLLLQRSSNLLTLGLMAVSMTVYALTVYAPQKWTTEYNKLEKLRNYERNLLATNESLKYNITEDIEQSAADLIYPTPENAIFLPGSPDIPETDRDRDRDRDIKEEKPQVNLKLNIPMGY